MGQVTWNHTLEIEQTKKKPPTQSTKMGLCVKCGQIRHITRDHIIPRWLNKRCDQFGIKRIKILGKANIQQLCAPCNNSKGGKIDWEHPLVRSFMRKIADWIYANLDKHDIHSPNA